MIAAIGSLLGPAFMAAWILGCVGLNLHAMRIVVTAAHRRGWSRRRKIATYAAFLGFAVPVAAVIERQDRLARQHPLP